MPPPQWREHLPQCETSHRAGHSTTLHRCVEWGAGWGQWMWDTTRVFSGPRATSWMHWTWRVWTPFPHSFEQLPNSETDHLFLCVYFVGSTVWENHQERSEINGFCLHWLFLVILKTMVFYQNEQSIEIKVLERAHLGGHGISLHVRVIESGLSTILQR